MSDEERNDGRARGWRRRDVLRSIGGLGLAGAGAVAARGQGTPEVDGDALARTSWLTGLELTAEEAELMLPDLAETLRDYERLRAVPLDNSVAPSIVFDPAPAEPGPGDGAGAVGATSSPAGRILAIPGVPSETGDAPSAGSDGTGDIRWGRRSGAPRPPAPFSVDVPPLRTEPGSAEDVAHAGLRELAGWLRAGKLSSLELTDLYLGRLERFDPQLSCVVERTVEIARSRARRADAERLRGEARSPLHGIPWGAKDLLAYPGTRTTWGARPYREQRIETTATVAGRLVAEGAPLLAKLSVGALAWGDVWFGGTTKNPWKPDQGSSGSSAGPAAATAAGLVGFSIGTETWGSIVSPSTRCGTTGLRPTFGRVSRAGVMALSWTMDKVGPICRRVEDCAWVLATIEGPDGRDPSVRTRPPFTWPPRSPREIRVGFVPSLFAADRTEGIEDPGSRRAAAEWQENDRRVLDALRALGWDLVGVELPSDLPIGPLSLILTAEATTAFDELTRSGRDDELVRQERYAWPNVFRQGQLIPAVEYLRANRIRTLLRARMEEVFRRVDVFVAPTFGGDHLLATNLTGHPSLCVPNGFRSADGTPTSITFTGRLFGESDLLAVGQAYQEATRFHLRRPPVGRG